MCPTWFTLVIHCVLKVVVRIEERIKHCFDKCEKAFNRAGSLKEHLLAHVVRSHRSVGSVRRHSLKLKIWRSISSHILVRRHTSVGTVRRHLTEHPLWRSISSPSVVSSRSSVGPVIRHLLDLEIWRSIYSPIVGRHNGYGDMAGAPPSTLVRWMLCVLVSLSVARARHTTTTTCPCPSQPAGRPYQTTLNIWISDTQMALSSKSPAEREKSPARNARMRGQFWEPGMVHGVWWHTVIFPAI